MVDVFGEWVQPIETHFPFVTGTMIYSDLWVEQFEFKGEFWRPLIQTRKEHESKLREMFELKLRWYYEDAIRWLDLRPELTKEFVKPDTRDYECLALFLCKPGTTIQAIGDAQNLSRERVRDVITELAEFLGLTEALQKRERSRGGRKRGSEDKAKRRRAKKNQ
jgi:hypothetical protein